MDGVLNQIAFNMEAPILIVGDSKGVVHSLKLSPNLRKMSKEAEAALQNEDMFKYRQAEVNKVEKILSQVIQKEDKISEY